MRSLILMEAVADLLKLSDETDLDILNHSMEAMVDWFKTELLSVASQLTARLCESYLCLAREGLAQQNETIPDSIDVESLVTNGDDDKVYGAMGVAKTIGTVVSCIESSPEILSQVTGAGAFFQYQLRNQILHFKFNARALASLVTVACHALSNRFIVILGASVKVLEEDQEEDLRSAIDEAIARLLIVYCFRAKSDAPKRRISSCNLFAVFCEESDLHRMIQKSSHSPTEEPCVLAASSSDSQRYHPYPNRSSFQLGDWYWNQGVQKSQGDFTTLLDILSDETFKTADVTSTQWKKINCQLGANEYDDKDVDEWEDEDAGWKKSSISIDVPFSRTSDTPGPQSYQAANLYHRSLVPVIREKLTNARDNKLFHYEPYQLCWNPPHLDGEVPIYGDMYTSPAFLEAHTQLQDLPGEPGCDLPRVVVGLMFWSDATQLTTFGNAKLWPTYMYFANESKYRRCKPSCNLSNHVAYFETLPESFKDFAGRTSEGATHCRRELFQEQWNVLLDDEFVEAYTHGIVIHCCDGITRRFYPRVFTYSADYPEKVLIATVRNLGGCPCPRCLIPKGRIQNMGRPQDRKQRETLERSAQSRENMVSTARKLIYEKNYAVGSAPVENILKAQSWVPTLNAFIDRLGAMGFNIFHALVVDLLHEFEIGVWKMLFTHLLRILSAQDKGLIDRLDKRKIPTFGAATIRKFSANASEMTCMAARNFEDLLQCSIPVFDGLLPEPHNRIVLELLFTMAHWHGLAKLRMHSDLTLEIMDEVTSTLGRQFREFKNTVCTAYQTRELPREVGARARRLVKKAGKETTGHKGKGSSSIAAQGQNVQRTKVFNFQTYKFHALGDYVSTIRRYGTSDSYSTEPGELEHRSPKARYCRTDRRSDRIIHRPHVEISELATRPEAHHHIGLTQKYPTHIGSYLRSLQGDSAIINFFPKLKSHLLCRVNMSKDSINEHDTNTIIIKDDRMYRHNIARINYTTYDVRRAQDVINPRTPHCNVMVLRPYTDVQDEGHRYMYAKVIGIYHVNVIFIGNGMIDYTPLRMEFLWVRWYEPIDQHSTWETSTLDRLTFPPLAHENSFDFLDPADVLRGCHIIPRFSRHKKHVDGLGVSASAGDKDDWNEYFVNRFVDRDMLMRFHFGLGVGHVYSHHRNAQAMHQRDDSAVQCRVEESDEEDCQSRDENESMQDDEDDDDVQMMDPAEQWYGSSQESLVEQFEAMYESELELDYEN
ncbi:hypothetical protein P692DRAFT_20879278 [Suillus brevipes Sb2]|nr:hypothetical protein P692DRAFT_20879278 [Suillus brevipes Sb2]